MAALWQDPETGILAVRKRIPSKYRCVAREHGHKGDIVELSTGTTDQAAAKQRLPLVMKHCRLSPSV